MMMCRDIVDAMTDAQEGKLGGLRKVLYGFHMKVCPFCQAHEKQLETTVATMKALPKEAPASSAREKALAAFRKNRKEGV